MVMDKLKLCRFKRDLFGSGWRWKSFWSHPIEESSSGMTGSSVFDFEGDGAAEVVYADEETLWIFDGATGTIEMAWTEHGSGTRFEYPTIVDIDADGSAENIVSWW